MSDACPVCNDERMVIVAGPDSFGMYDADDCPCQMKEVSGEEEAHEEEVAVALRLLDQAVAEHNPSHIFALFSGGHDSLTTTFIAAQHPRFSGVVHINTGIGIEETRQFVRDTCETHGWPLHEVKAEEGLYERLVLERGGFPGGPQSHNSMLFYLKQQPLARWFKTVKGKRVVFVTGIRKDESDRREEADISVPIRADGRKVWVSPILDWSKIDCGRLIERHNLTRNPVVDLLHRSGECLCGAMANEREIHEIAAWYPDTAARINELEWECERRGIVACVWAGRSAAKLNENQSSLFPKSMYAPLCHSCKAAA